MSVTKEELDKYIKAYSQGTPLIEDSEYDALLDEYLKEHGESARPFTRQKQSSAVNDIVGTLPKVYGVQTPMRENQPVYEEWVNKHQVSDLVCVQPKFDGTSVAYDVASGRFYTRGDYDNGESVDVTDIFKSHTNTIHDWIVKRYDDVTAVKFEAILDVNIFKSQFSQKYKRPRDVVAAAITSRNAEVGNLITLVPLRVYTWKFQHIPDMLMEVSVVYQKNDYECIQAFVDRLLSNQAHCKIGKYEFECDGVVVSSTIHIDEEGEDVVTDPSTEVAIKILNLVKETKLKDISWQFGNSGHITPVAIVEPVTFGNVVVQNIGLSTFERVANMNLKFGDTVRIMYNIVPYFIGSNGDGSVPIPIPDKCPICGEKLNMSSLKQVKCINPNCDGVKCGNIIRYCKNMKVFGVSEGFIKKLYESRYVERIADLYVMDLLEASEVDGLGFRSLQNMIRSLKQASFNVPVSRWLGSFPCENVSNKKWEIILESVYGKNNPEMIKDITEMCARDTPNDFLNKILWDTVGIGPLTEQAIRIGITRYWDDISTIIYYVKFEIPIAVQNDKGTICISGTRDKDLIALLQQKGYDVTEAWNKGVKALVIPRITYQSSKVAKAQNLGKPIYTIDDVMNGAL